MNLYDLGDKFYTTIQKINDRIAEGEKFDSPADKQELREALGLEGEWKEKALNFARYIISEKAKIKIIDEEIQRLQKLKRKHQNPIDYFMPLMQSQMQEYGVPAIEDEIVKIRLQDNSSYSVDIVDLEKIPEKYKTEKLDIKVDKRAIIKDREELIAQGIDCVVFEKGQHLRIS